MNSSEPERVEDLSQLIARIKDTYGVSESEIGRRLEVSTAIVNAWVHRKRGNKRGPAREILLRIPVAFPKITEAEVFAAAGRKTPGPLSPEGEERMQGLYRELTAEQQKTVELLARALAESNKSAE